jgi:YesN/AraC family two-component response regulator
MLAARTALNCTDLGSDLYFSAKLFCQQKLEMMKCVRLRDFTRAKSALSRLLTVTVIQHYETPQTLKLAVLELFLALFDAALDEGTPMENIIRLRHTLMREWENASDPEGLCLWIIRAIDNINECLNSVMRDKSIRLRDRVNKFIETHLSEDLTVHHIAKELGFSSSRLMHLMRSECNISLGNSITRVRMDTAKHLLRNSDMPMSVIAQEVGYKDQGYFTRVFRKSQGETPQAYRKKIVASAQSTYPA